VCCIFANVWCPHDVFCWLSGNGSGNIASTRVIEQLPVIVSRELMQIATHNQDQPDMAHVAAGTWFVLERMLGFSHLAPACPGAAATK
jgi:hypothetical protein